MHRQDMLNDWLARLNADATIVGLLGANGFYPAQSGIPVTVPSVHYSTSYNPEGELFEKAGIRLDLFIRGATKAAALEQRIRDLSHRDISQVLGSRRCWIRYLDAADVPFPSDPDVTHRALDFELETVRSLYA